MSALHCYSSITRNSIVMDDPSFLYHDAENVLPGQMVRLLAFWFLLQKAFVQKDVQGRISSKEQITTRRYRTSRRHP